MPTKVRCPGCTKSLRCSDKAMGKKVKCPSCSTSFTVPLPSNALSTPAKDLSVSDQSVGNLESVTAYGPSGFCASPTSLFGLCVPGGVVFVMLAIILGATIAFVIGMVLTTLIRLPYVYYVLSERGKISHAAQLWGTFGGIIAAWWGAAIALGASLIVACLKSCLISRNRNMKNAAIYMASVGLLVICIIGFLCVAIDWFVNPNALESIAMTRWSRFVGLGLLPFAVLIAVASAGLIVRELPYCESCQSFLSEKRIARYEIDCITFRKLTKSGDIASIQAIPIVAIEKAGTIVSLTLCEKRCCGYLSISRARMIVSKRPESPIKLAVDAVPVIGAVTQLVKDDTKDVLKEFRTVVSGMIDPATADTWTHILDKQRVGKSQWYHEVVAAMRLWMMNHNTQN